MRAKSPRLSGYFLYAIFISSQFLPTDCCRSSRGKCRGPARSWFMHLSRSRRPGKCSYCPQTIAGGRFVLNVIECARRIIFVISSCPLHCVIAALLATARTMGSTYYQRYFIRHKLLLLFIIRVINV